MSQAKVPLTPTAYKFQDKEIADLVPIVNILLTCQHHCGKPVKCLLDTGSDFNIFPLEYGLLFLGFSAKTIKQGLVVQIRGVGGVTKEAYGHYCDIQHPNFRLTKSLILFMADQKIPLLGRVGFINCFNKVVYDMQNRVLDFSLSSA